MRKSEASKLTGMSRDAAASDSEEKVSWSGKTEWSSKMTRDGGTGPETLATRQICTLASDLQIFAFSITPFLVFERARSVIEFYHRSRSKAQSWKRRNIEEKSRRHLSGCASPSLHDSSSSAFGIPCRTTSCSDHAASEGKVVLRSMQSNNGSIHETL